MGKFWFIRFGYLSYYLLIISIFGIESVSFRDKKLGKFRKIWIILIIIDFI